MSKLCKRAHQGFTLVEIMIVVLIIGILLAIAVPNFIKARESSRAKSCVANLKQIESAKEQWAMDTKAAPTATPVDADLYGAAAYLKTTPASDPDQPVLIPGEPERIARARRIAEGIEIDATTWRDINEAAAQLGTRFDGGN